MKKLFTLAAAVLASMAMIAGEVVTWVPTSDDVTELKKTTSTAVTVGTGTKSFKIYSVRPFYNTNEVKIAWDDTEKAIKTTDNAIEKAGLAIYIPAGAEVEGITVFIHTSQNRKTYYAAASADKPSNSGTKTGSAVAQSSTGYDFWSTFDANKYYAFGGKSDGGGDLYYDSIKVTFKSGDPTKATVKSISVNDEALAVFAADKFSYDIELPYGTVDIPVVTAITGDDATVEITQATALPGAATVVCTSADGTSETLTYTLNFTVKASGNNDASLKDLKVNGTTLADFAADKFEYDVEIGIYEAITVVATQNDDNAFDPVIEDNGTNKVVVTVTAEDNTTTLTYTINYTRRAATELASISDDATWDFTKTGSSEIKFTDETIVKKGITEFNFADVLTNPDASFNAAALAGVGEFAVREGKYFQGSLLKFNTTVAGTLEVVYCNTGNRDSDGLKRILTINGTKIGEGSQKSSENVIESGIAIEAGEVAISSVLKQDETVQYIRIHKVTFTKAEPTALDNTEAEVKAVKVIRNGQLFIEKNGVLYNAQGARLQ